MPTVLIPVTNDGALELTYTFAAGTPLTIARQIANTLAQAVSTNELNVTTVSGSGSIPTAPNTAGTTQELFITESDDGDNTVPAGYEYVVNGATGPTTIVAAPGTTIVSDDGGGANYTETGNGAVNIAVAGEFNVITAGGTSGTILSGSGFDTINASGSNQLIVLAGSDSVSVSGSNDTIDAPGSGDTIDLAGNNDTINAIGDVGVSVTGSNNTMSVSGANQSVTLQGSVNVFLTGSNDTVTGGAGAETVNGSAGTGPVLMNAGTGTGVLIAGSGADTMVSGPADTFMTGGSGDDQFLIEKAFGGPSANIVINNFTQIDDAVFVGYTAGDVDQAFNNATVTGSGSVVITLSDGTTVTFTDVGSVSAVEPYTTETQCFLKGTSIRAPDRDVLVEHLRLGDRVTARFAGTAPIVWIGHRHVDCRRHPEPDKVWPVRITAGAFGDGLPLRDLLLSPDHAVFVDNVLIPLRHLINGITIEQVPMDAVTYYHLELPEHDLVLAEGLAIESYLDIGDRSAFANGGGLAWLHPDFSAHAWEAMGCAPLIVTGPLLDAVRARLNAQLVVPKPRRGVQAA
jgi:collagen type I/II/III/V/XI/XXIV/XXVII alpha